MRRYRVRHRTEYRYGAPVTNGHTIAHLVPRPAPGQWVDACEVVADPEPDHVAEHLDGFGNVVTILGVEQPHERLTVTATSDVTVEGTPEEEPAGAREVAWEDAARRLDACRSPDDLLARAFRLDSPLVAASRSFAAFAAPSFPPGRPLDEAVRALSAQLHTELSFDPGFSDVSTPIEQVLEARRGVCQDFAHLAIGCLRSLGLGARYVSGYLETRPPPGQPKLIGADASHAWCAVYAPGSGWLAFDPTNDQVPPHDHVTVAWGRDYADVAPVRGVVFGPATVQDLVVAVDVARLDT
jgi:transglutaminase-like putative cysteine protease